MDAKSIAEQTTWRERWLFAERSVDEQRSRIMDFVAASERPENLTGYLRSLGIRGPLVQVKEG